MSEYTKKELVKIMLVHCDVYTEQQMNKMSSKKIISIMDEFEPTWRLFPYNKRIRKEQKVYNEYKGLERQFCLGEIHKPLGISTISCSGNNRNLTYKDFDKPGTDYGWK